MKAHVACLSLQSFIDVLEGKLYFYRALLATNSASPQIKDMGYLFQDRVTDAYIQSKSILQSIILIKTSFDQKIQHLLIEKSSGLNEASKVFVAITTIALPFQFLSGIFGENVQVPYQHFKTLAPYSILVIVMFLMSVLLLIIFKCKKLL